MQVFRSVAIVSDPIIRPVSAKTLRQWCAPEVILVVTNLTDELVILPHAIVQAKPSHAKIILSHVVTPMVTSSNTSCRSRKPTVRLQEARATLERMARNLRWLGFVCEPVVLTGLPEIEIPSLARSCCADRVMIGFEDNPDSGRTPTTTLAGQLLSNLDVPTCVIGKNVSLPSAHGQFTKGITIATSLKSDCDVPLSFACRLAQEQRAKLTLFHVFERKCGDDDISAPMPLEIASKLPVPTWREAELLCPTEITIREGDAGDEILKYSLSNNPDMIILCSPGERSYWEDWRESVSSRVIAGANCPVFVLKRQPVLAKLTNAGDGFPEKVSAYGECLTTTTQKEDVM
jgi:hypothetical protein